MNPFTNGLIPASVQRWIGVGCLASYGALYVLVHQAPPVLSGEGAVVAGAALTGLALALQMWGIPVPTAPAAPPATAKKE